MFWRQDQDRNNDTALECGIDVIAVVTGFVDRGLALREGLGHLRQPADAVVETGDRRLHQAVSVDLG
jgi:hypothetical protein